jgi:tetratricopeptide (TPR) repeat protein
MEQSAEEGRRKTLRLLVACLLREVEKSPVCLIVEDVQWIDPSTHEVLIKLIEVAERLPLLILVTERRDGPRKFRLGFRAHEIRLQRLSRHVSRRMILSAFGEHGISSNIVGLIVEKSDGVPLYIEESARLTLEREAAGSSAAEHSSSWSVPATINDLLMARLDRVGAAKLLTGLGAVIGREFSLPLLEAALRRHLGKVPEQLTAQLEILLNSALLVRKGTDRQPCYYFKHALVRDAAYESMLRSERIALHRILAEVIEDDFRELAERHPEQLAYHYSEAGMATEAVVHWERAARLAASRSALTEAINHVRAGLSAVARLPAGSERDRTELRLQLLLAGQLIATEGYGADRVERVYARASELCRVAGDEIALLKTQLGLEGFHFMRADFAKAHEIAIEATALTRRSADPMRKLQSEWAVANIRFHLGELVPAVAQMDACLKAYGRLAGRRSVVQDPGVMCLCYSAWGKWQLGYPDQALQRAHRVVLLSERANHKFSMAEAYGFSASVHHFRGENREALRCAERAIEICEPNGFSVWLAHARLMRGRALAEQGEHEAGIREMKEAYALWAATGAIVTVPFHLAMQAEGLLLAGRPAEGLERLHAAHDLVCRYGERYYEAEVLRLLGELLLEVKGDNSAWTAAEGRFRQAIECAHRLELRSMSLRGAISLSRLMIVQGRFAEALGVLKPEYEWFTEGHGTRDLRAAGELLQALSSDSIPA